MFKLKYNIKIILHENYSKRNIKQKVDSREIVSLATICRQFDFLKQSVVFSSYTSSFEIIINSDIGNMYVFAVQ